MYSIKKPEAEVRLLYPRLFEAGLAFALVVLTVVFLTSKRFEEKAVVQRAEEVILETEEIPITQQVKKPPPPARPSIPVEDPDVDLEDDIAFDDITEIDWQSEAPPPPPQSIEDEVVDFFAVEVAPVMAGGEEKLMNYLVKNNLYPEMARRAQIEGIAIIHFVVDTNGKPINVEAFQEKPQGLGFGEAGVKAIAAMTFSPGMQRDRPVKVKMSQVIRFQLRN